MTNKEFDMGTPLVFYRGSADEISDLYKEIEEIDAMIKRVQGFPEEMAFSISFEPPEFDREMDLEHLPLKMSTAQVVNYLVGQRLTAEERLDQIFAEINRHMVVRDKGKGNVKNA